MLYSGALLSLPYFWLETTSVSTSFDIYLIWQPGKSLQVGLTLEILNSLASQPLGHMAGFATNIVGDNSTVTAANLASFVNILFDGIPVPLNTSSPLFVII